MRTFIEFTEFFSDDDIRQIRITVCDGASTSIMSAYVGLDWLEEAATALERFRHQIHGGLYDLEAGRRGPEFADGAFSARFHWFRSTHLLISTTQQSDFFQFKDSQVAREATLYLRCEPAALDQFVADLRGMQTGSSQTIALDCVPLDGAPPDGV